MTLERVLQAYRAVNGDHPMTAADDAYVRAYFSEVPDVPKFPRELLWDLMSDGLLPLPSYVLSDGTPMVHADYLTPLGEVGSVEALHDWFVAQWPQADRDVAEEEWSAYLSGQYVCLWSVTPTTIQAKTETIEAIKAELAALAEGQGSLECLAVAVDRLDALEPPFTGYDELRFGGPTSRHVWIDQVRSTYGLHDLRSAHPLGANVPSHR